MSFEAVRQTIELVKDQVAEIQSDLLEKQTTVNNLCSIAGLDPFYSLEKVSELRTNSPLVGDEYYSRSATVAIRLVLESRKSKGNGPATLIEIYETLLLGGYLFEAKNETNSKNSLRVTLSKNSKIFHKLPNRKFGLVKWYDVKPLPRAAVRQSPPGGDDEAEANAAMEKEFKQVSAKFGGCTAARFAGKVGS